MTNINEDMVATMTPRNRAIRIVVGLLIAGLMAACGGGVDAEGEEREADHEEGFVELDASAVSAVEIEMVTVEEGFDEVLEATGTVIYDQNRVAYVGPRAEGRVVEIARDLGDRVEAGTVLAVLESPELGEAEAQHDASRAELELARENHEREQALYDKGISSRKEMLEARTAYDAAQAAFRASEARHRTLGALGTEATHGGNGAMFSVVAPLAGTVVERGITLGQIAGPEDRLFTVAALQSLWLTLDIYDKDLTRVREGQIVEVRVAPFGEEVFHGRVSYLGQVIDSITRTVKARVEIQNMDERLRPGMFARATITGLDAAGTVTVHESAIQNLEGRDVVFVAVAGSEPPRFEIRGVVLGTRVGGDRIIVLEGLGVGETVVGVGSFYLKSEILKESFAPEH